MEPRINDLTHDPINDATWEPGITKEKLKRLRVSSKELMDSCETSGSNYLGKLLVELLDDYERRT